MEEYIARLEAALAPFKGAAERLAAFGTECKGAPLFADHENCLYELMDSADDNLGMGPLYTDHLRAAKEALESKPT